jgi:periplasmic protein TonB
VSRHSRHRKSAVPIGRTLVIVAGIHVLLGAGVFALAQTEVGQRMIKQYKVSLADKPKQEEKKEPPKKDEPPPPPEPKLQAPPPDVAAAPTAPSAGVHLGGGGGGLAYGGRFQAPTGSGGAVGAFNASVERRFRQYYREPRDDFGAAQLELRVGSRGEVLSYQLARSSGSATNDASILDAAGKLQKDGVMAPPKGRERIVLVKVTPY